MRIISQVDFAKKAGVSRAAISSRIKKGTLPSVDGKIDIDDLSCQEYLEKRKEAQIIKQVSEHNQRKKDYQVNNLARIEKNIINDLASGKSRADLESEKLEADIELKHLSIAEKKGTLISRNLMIRCFFNPVQTCFTRLEYDAPGNLAAQLIPKILSKSFSKEEIVDFITKQLSTYIKPAKQQMIKNLKDLKDLENE